MTALRLVRAGGDPAGTAGGPSAGGPSAGGPSAGGPSAGGPSAGGPSAGGRSAWGRSAGNRAAEAGREFSLRLRSALGEGGPLAADLCLYLGSRADLFRPEECLTLSAPGDEAAPRPTAEVRAQIAAEVGRPEAEIFAGFDETPLRCRLLHQTHRARLSDGTPVHVRVLSPLPSAPAAAAAALARQLRRAFPPKGFPVDEILADHRHSLEERLDLTREADALHLLAGLAHGSDLLAVPRVHRALCRRGVLVIEQLEGRPLDEIAAGGIETGTEARHEGLARHFSLVWLQLAFATGTFPVDGSVVVLGDGRMALTGGAFAALSPAARVNLWNYLRATAAHQSERAGGYLLQELQRGSGGAAAERALMLRLRQAVPFRDGSWTEAADTFAEHLLLHARIARECGFRSPQPLQAFFRGLVWVGRTGRRLHLDGDPLVDGLEGLNWLAAFSQAREMTLPGNVAGSMEEMVSTLLQLPQKIDRVLKLDNGDGSSLRRDRDPVVQRVWNSSATVACVLMAMAALVLLSRQFGAADAGWAQPLSALVFLALGAFLLAATRNRGGNG